MSKSPDSKALVKEGEMYEGNQEYAGLGIVKWCALCKVHRSQLGGTVRKLFGGRHWVCSKHKDPK